MASNADDVDSDGESNILYDLTIHAEWPQEAEAFTRIQKEKPQISSVGRLASATQRSVWTSLRTLGLLTRNASPCSLPTDLVHLVNSQLNWHIAVNSEGTLLAVLQDQHVEIRSARDEYGSVVGRGSLGRDPHPQWRCTAWSPDSTMVAVSASSGTVHVFDIVGSLLMTIPGESPPTPMAAQDLSRAVAALIFIETPESSPWTAELLVINYHGSLTSYYLEREKGYKLRHRFQFSTHYPLGVGSVVYHPGHSLLYVGGCGEAGHVDQSSSRATQEGITAWRVLSDSPHYKLVTDYTEDLRQAQQHSGLMKRVKNFTYYSWYGSNPDGVFKMCLSPSGQILVAIHQSGKLSLWDVPSLRKRQSWAHEDQPGHDDISPDFSENPVKRKVLKDIVQSRSLIDVNWWSDKEIILARCSGAVSVSSFHTLRNLLGSSPEWFEPAPHITETKDGGFLGLECECQFPSLKRRLVATDDEHFDDSDDEETSVVTKTTRLTKQLLYYITDSERFQPPRKRPKMVTRIYRLVRLKSTTPEELYEKKISNEEYGEALALARAYGLDCDKVYQRQWRKSPVSVASIQDYLSKISKRSWVLHECLERVPENIDAMKELLEYGLRGTDLQALIAIGKGEDGGRFILCDYEDEEYEDMTPGYHDDQVEQETREERKAKRREELMQQVDFNSLNLEQRQLCKDRLKLLQYLDRLSTYEMILGGTHAAEMRFDSRFFEKFRAQNIVEAAVNYAQMSDDKALDVLFTFHGDELRQHRLAILSNFPETTSPYEYRTLLPEVRVGGEDGEPWTEDTWRDKDWCEQDDCRNSVDPIEEDCGAFLYEENNDYKKFCTALISGTLLTEWYDYRACEIDGLASQVDHALELVKLGQERGVQGLEDLYDDLVTMETMVYECGLEDGVELQKVRKLTSLEKLQLLMSKSSVEMYCKNVRRWMVPFLQRCEGNSPGAYNSILRDYIVTASKTDLTLSSKLFDLSKPGVSYPIIKDSVSMMSMTLDAVYSTERDDQLKLAVFIFECLPNKVKSKKESPEELKLSKQVDELERHLRAGGILEKYGVKLTSHQIKEIQSDPEETRNLIVKLTRKATRSTPALKETDYWSLLDDVQIIQTQVFRAITQDLCLQIFAESLLCSEKQETIGLVGQLIERSATEKWEANAFHGKLPYDTAISLVIKAAREYFDSSANLTDPCMDLARACLHLIRDCPTSIQEELDLISSLAILDDFGVLILPLQVRMMKDRLSLVGKCVENRPNAYKQSQKLLRLGHLLRVPGETQVDKDGQVLHLLVNAAIKSGDYEFANDICQQLMMDNYDPIWTACRDLAEQVNFRDIRAKAELLSFAVTYCEPAMIEPILKAKCLLETQILFDTVSTQMESETDGFLTPRSSPFTATAALQQTTQLLASTTKTTKHLLSSTTQTTRAVLSTVTDTKWWQRTLSSIKQPSTKLTTQPSREEIDDGNVGFEKQGCPEFYASLTHPSYISKKSYNEEEITLSGDLLRTAKLEELITEGHDSKPSTEVLLRLASLTLPYDSMLGLAYLLALNKGEEAESVFEDLPNSGVSLQLAAYYYSLQIYSHLCPYLEAEGAPLYCHHPSTVIQNVMNHVTSKKVSDWPEEVRNLGEKVQLYNELMEDYTQAKVLQGLGRGVDVVRFTEDTEYKHETILGLAMSLEDKVYEIAVSLAERYNLSLWEVYMTHLEFLFSDSGLSTSEMESRVETLDLLEKLTTNSKDFRERMEKYVLPTIEGTDHSRLLYYYALLSSCETEESEGSVAPDVHVKLLQKLKSATPGLDYRKLMDGKHEPMDVIQPIINSGNVHVLAKLANKIPDQRGGFLHPSVVFAGWAVKLFWQGDQSNKRTPDTTSEWVHRYEVCGDFLQRLIPCDLISCAQRIVFTKHARIKLSQECRFEIVKRMLKLSRQQGGKKKKMEIPGNSMTWEEAANQLQRLQSHVELLTNETLQSMALSSDPRLQEYADLYDLSQGDPQQLKRLLVQMLLDGQSPDLLQDVLSVQAVDKWTPRTATQQAVTSLISTLQGGNSEEYDLRDDDSLSVLQRIIETVQEHQDAGGDLVCSEDLVSLLRPFCADATVSAQPRLDVLEMLEKSFPVSEEDMVLLTLYRTNAIVSAGWPQHAQLSEDCVISDVSRQALFDELISQSTGVDQYLSLSQLLRLWPKLSTSNASGEGDISASPWSQLFRGLVSSSQGETTQAVLSLVKDLHNSAVLNQQTTQYVSGLLIKAEECVPAVKVVLLSPHTHLYSPSLLQLRDTEADSVDDELSDLILKRRLITEVVGFPVYQKLAAYVTMKQVDNPPSDSYLMVDTVAGQLKEAGFVTEAGTLVLQCRGTHPLLQTFSAARNVLGRWLKQ